MSGRKFLELRVISVWVVKDSNCEELFIDNGKSCVKSKEYRSKDRSFWDTEGDGKWPRGVAVDADRLSAVCKVG